MSVRDKIKKRIKYISRDLHENGIEFPERCEIGSLKKISNLHYPENIKEKICEIIVLNLTVDDSPSLKSSITKKFLSYFSTQIQYKICLSVIDFLLFNFNDVIDDDIHLILKKILLFRELQLIDLNNLNDYCKIIKFLLFSYPVIQEIKCEYIRLFYFYSMFWQVSIMFTWIINKYHSKEFRKILENFFIHQRHIHDFHVLLTISIEFYFNILHIKPLIEDILNSERLELNFKEISQAINNGYIPKLGLIYGAILKCNKLKFLKDVISYVITMDECLYITDSFNSESYFAEKCFSIFFKKSLERYNQVEKLEFEVSLKECLDILEFYINGILSSSTDIHYSYRNSFIKFIEFVKYFCGAHYTDEIYLILIKNVGFDGNFSFKSIKIYHLLFVFVQIFGIDYVLDKTPTFLTFLINNVTQRIFEAKILHIYSHLVLLGINVESKNEDLYHWLMVWLYPILNHKSQDVNHLIMYQMVSVWNSSLRSIIDKFEMQVVRSELILFLGIDEIYPNVLPLISIALKKIPDLHLQANITNKIFNYLYSTHEEASVESLNILCLYEKDPNLSFKYLIKYLKCQPISQKPNIRESLLKIINRVFTRLYKSKNIKPCDYITLVKEFFYICLIASNRSYYGRSLVAWSSIDIILKTSYQVINKSHENITLKRLSETRNINYFFERMSGMFDHESSISFLILNTIHSRFPDIFDKKMIARIFESSLILISNNRIENERISSYFMKFISNMPHNKIIDIIPYKSEKIEDSKSHLINFLFHLLQEKFNDLNNEKIENFTLHAVVSCMTSIIRGIDQILSLHLYMRISERLIEYLKSITKIILTPSSETFYFPVFNEMDNSNFVFDEISHWNKQAGISGSYMYFMWRFTKECCSFLCDGAVIVLKNSSFVKYSHIINLIYDIFEYILLNSLHVGIYESTVYSFKEFAKEAWLVEKLAKKLEYSLFNTINLLTENSKNPPNIISTRRGAGLPLYLEILIMTAPIDNQKYLVDKLINKIKHIITNSDEFSIKSRVICINVIRHLFHSTKISSNLHDYIEEFFAFSIIGVSSKIWQIKNSSLLLFSILTRNLLGDTDGKEYKINASYLLKYYPTLCNQINNMFLKIIKSQLESGDYHLITCFLLIIKRLGFSSINSNPISEHFLLCSYKLFNCPNYKIRTLSVDCMLKFIPRNMFVENIYLMLSNIENCIDKCFSLNFIHSLLDLVQCLTHQISQNIEEFTPHISIEQETTINYSRIFEMIQVCRLCANLYNKILNNVKSINKNEPFMVSFVSESDKNIEKYKQMNFDVTNMNEIFPINKHSEIIVVLKYISNNFTKLNTKYKSILFKLLNINKDLLIADLTTQDITMVWNFLDILRFSEGTEYIFELAYFVISFLKTSKYAKDTSYNTLEPFYKYIDYSSKDPKHISKLCKISFSLLNKINLKDDYISIYYISLCFLVYCGPNMDEKGKVKGGVLIYDLLKHVQENNCQNKILITVIFFCSFLLLNDESSHVRYNCAEYIIKAFYDHKKHTNEYLTFEKLIKYFYHIIASFISYIISTQNIYSLFENPIFVIDSYFKINGWFKDITFIYQAKKNHSHFFNNVLFEKEQILNEYFDPLLFLTNLWNFISDIPYILVDDISHNSEMIELFTLKSIKNIQIITKEIKNNCIKTISNIHYEILVSFKTISVHLLIFSKMKKNINENIKIRIDKLFSLISFDQIFGIIEERDKIMKILG